MASYMHYKGYTARVDYAVQTGIFYARILRFDPALECYCGTSIQEIRQKFESIVDQYIKNTANRKEVSHE